jgi:hypothetical protein
VAPPHTPPLCDRQCRNTPPASVVLVALKAPGKLNPQGLDQLMGDAWVTPAVLEPRNLDDLSQLGAQAMLSEHLDQLPTNEIVRVVLNYRTGRA